MIDSPTRIRPLDHQVHVILRRRDVVLFDVDPWYVGLAPAVTLAQRRDLHVDALVDPVPSRPPLAAVDLGPAPYLGVGQIEQPPATYFPGS